MKRHTSSKYSLKTVEVATGSTRHSLEKYCKKGNSETQESSHCNFVGGRPGIPNSLLVWITPTDSPYFEFGEAIPCCQKVSAHAELNGYFKYNYMLVEPLGYAVHRYVKPHSRKLWAEHSDYGYYVGKSDEHYMCHNI